MLKSSPGYLRWFQSSKSKSYSNVADLADGIRSHDRCSLARAITLVESRRQDDLRQGQELIKQLEKWGVAKKQTVRIGISGSPGVGKSSLIERLGMHCIESEGLKVATLAIDPSSTRSGGSILGDKTRMSRLANDPRAFVRPSPSGGQLGGVSRGTFLSIKLCELAGYDVVLVESVGVGQSETELSDLTDIFVLCVAPNSGDEVQSMKRGINERADLILVNKADEPLSEEARQTLMELKMSQYLRSHPAQVIPVSAMRGTGIKEAWTAMKHLQSDLLESGQFMARREDQHLKWLKSFIRSELMVRFEGHLTINRNHLIDCDPLELSDAAITDFCSKNNK